MVRHILKWKINLEDNQTADSYLSNIFNIMQNAQTLDILKRFENIIFNDKFTFAYFENLIFKKPKELIKKLYNIFINKKNEIKQNNNSINLVKINYKDIKLKIDELQRNFFL